ncbi:UNVERIFIED_CONTAM: Receptor-like protein 33 [Sesamum radiatum]|uniref:Receptor-like protein 33 n=1 Tax=Sesamum radiatum TaxID=300843 RepID=A0AAW2KSV5_SESRA
MITLTQLLFLSLLSIFCTTNIAPVFSQCLEDQMSLLLGLKNTLIFDYSASRKLVRWNQTTDCCSWDGVECDVAGHVISLLLDEEIISGGIESSEDLFRLSYLQKLNLAFNTFDSIQIPKGLQNLTHLTHLNLSNAGFGGQVPNEILSMRSLVSLDLSSLFPGVPPLKLESPNLQMLVQNLTRLRELYLDSVDVSAQATNWSQVLSSSLPDLRNLSLRYCSLRGPIDASLTKLRSLTVLRLDGNNLASEVANFFANLSKLTTLSLSSCSLVGSFPEKIFQLHSLQTLDLSDNMQLSGTLPQFPPNGSLRTVVLSYTSFSGSLPESISNLVMLSRLELSNCGFTGPIPPTIANLTELEILDISSNNFTGSLPLFQLSKKLIYVDAGRNSLTGLLSSKHFEGLTNLEYINLGHNLLSSSIPSSLFALPSLQKLELSNNQFHGQVKEFSNPSSSSLEVLDVSSNHLQGPIPKFFSELEQLKVLSLSSNFFNGTVQLEMFKNPNLSRLDLSYNDLFVDSTRTNSTLPILPSINVLNLASCKLQKFPELARHLGLFRLDVSSNQLKGEVPNWIWDIGNGSLRQVNLSFNEFHGFQKPYKFPSLTLLDLHPNKFQGELPIPPFVSIYVDYSFNYFSNSIPEDIGNFISYASFFSVSNNNLTGEIPTSICNATFLQVLDLSGNALTGSIPPCLPMENWSLGVLSLGRNNFSGNIPDTFSVNCSLKTLDLNRNVLKGKIPASLVNCPLLEVLNIGNNGIEDTFPCMLMNTSLRVLILRSNKFYGDLQCSGAIQGWSNLQIIDISTNNFGGDISLLSFSNWKGMVSVKENQSQYNHLRFDYLKMSGYYYQDAVTVTIKGLEMELTKILIVFTSIDFSRNKFNGSIPHTIGDLKSLYLLNLSHNALTGLIPTSIENLRQLGSLDLSVNHLTGKIPQELASLTFLSFLNLSSNRLFGKIPQGPQFQTFSAASYEGNAGLCGFPVNISCNDKVRGGNSSPELQNGQLYPEKEIEWSYISAALGFAVGLASIIWLLQCCERWRKMYFGQIDRILLKIFPLKDGRKGRGQRTNINQVRRR